MKKFIVGLIAGMVVCFLVLCVYWIVQTVSYYRNSNVVGGHSSRSPDGMWNVRVNDEYSQDLEKNFLSFGIYESNGCELAYTRFEHHGGTARSSKIFWSDDGGIVTVAVRLNPNGGGLTDTEIQYYFVENELYVGGVPREE